MSTLRETLLDIKAKHSQGERLGLRGLLGEHDIVTFDAVLAQTSDAGVKLLESQVVEFGHAEGQMAAGDVIGEIRVETPIEIDMYEVKRSQLKGSERMIGDFSIVFPERAEKTQAIITMRLDVVLI